MQANTMVLAADKIARLWVNSLHLGLRHYPTPTPEQLDILRAEIAILAIREPEVSWFSIGSDYHPDPELEECFNKAGILRMLCPIKTRTWIKPGRIEYRCNGWGHYYYWLPRRRKWWYTTVAAEEKDLQDIIRWVDEDDDYRLCIRTED